MKRHTQTHTSRSSKSNAGRREHHEHQHVHDHEDDLVNLNDGAEFPSLGKASSYEIGSRGVFLKIEKFLDERKWTLRQLYKSMRVNKDQKLDSIKKGEGYAFYCYKPHAIWGMADVVMLEEPKFDPAKYKMVNPKRMLTGTKNLMLLRKMHLKKFKLDGVLL